MFTVKRTEERNTAGIWCTLPVSMNNFLAELSIGEPEESPVTSNDPIQSEF